MKADQNSTCSLSPAWVVLTAVSQSFLRSTTSVEMILNKVFSLESLCLTSLETLVFKVSLQTSKLIIKLLPDLSEMEDDLPGQKKEVHIGSLVTLHSTV